jgi:hypothetical protein
VSIRVKGEVLAIVFAVLLFAAPAMAKQDAAPEIAVAACGDLQSKGVYEIVTRHVSCVLARRVVRQWLAQCEADQKNPCLTTSRFFCRAAYLSFHENTYRCVYEADRRKARVSQRAVRFFLRG